MKILLFDIDGTLLLTGGAGRIAFERVFEELFGIRNAWGSTVPDGKTDPAIIDEIARRVLGRSLAALEYAELSKQYLDQFRIEIKSSPRFRLLPGVAELLESAAERKDLALGIVTGNFEEAAWCKLEKGGIRHHFRFGGFGSDSPDRTEIARMAWRRAETSLGTKVPAGDIFVIGDTGQDIAAAKNLGARVMAVATGCTKEAELAQHKPDYLFPNLLDLEKFFRAVKGLLHFPPQSFGRTRPDGPAAKFGGRRAGRTAETGDRSTACPPCPAQERSE